MRNIIAVLKMRYIEQLRDGYEDGPIFDIVYFDGEAREAPHFVRTRIADTLFPNCVEDSAVGGYDYLVLSVRDHDNDVELKPGDFVVFRENSSFTTLRGFDTAEVIDGKLRLS